MFDKNKYLDKVMEHAVFERIEDGTVFGSIDLPAFKGVWSDTPTEEEGRKELRSVLEGWVDLNIGDKTPLPEVDGLKLEVGRTA